MNYKWHFLLVFGALIFVLAFSQEPEKKKYSQPSTIPFNWENPSVSVTDYLDTLSDDTLHQVTAKEGMPLYYFRNIRTGVCFDNKCRPLDIIMYWNITGRYLGFELPEEEFLSKYEHEPFTPEEYKRLNTLLADSLLPLGDVSFEELIRPSVKYDSVDGVSGATSQEILDFVVEGAAYTTHTLWNIIYGPSQDLVISLTEKKLTADLLILILKSPSMSDKIWALHRIDKSMPMDDALANTVMEMIGGDDYFLAYTAINTIQPNHLNSDALQISLFSKYTQVDYSLQKPIIDKLIEAPKLATEVIEMSWKMLENVNGAQLGNILQLYEKHGVHDMATCQAVARLLSDDNAFISKKAYNFLKDLEIQDEKIKETLKNYSTQ